MDRGANGVIAGPDTREIAPHGTFTNLNGIDEHTVRDLPLMIMGAHTETQRGPVIMIYNQAAKMFDGFTIIAPGQLEANGWTCHDKSPKITGRPACLISPEGYILPLGFRHGLPYLKQQPFTDHEWATLPHVFATAPQPWDPTCLDAKVDNDWLAAQPADTPYFLESDYDEFGNLKDRSHILGDDDDDEDNANGHDLPVTRRDLKAFATQLIAPELEVARRAFVHTRRQRRLQQQALSHPLPTPHPSTSRDGEKTESRSRMDNGETTDGESTDAGPPPLQEHKRPDSSEDDSDSEIPVQLHNRRRKPRVQPRKRNKHKARTKTNAQTTSQPDDSMPPLVPRPVGNQAESSESDRMDNGETTDGESTDAGPPPLQERKRPVFSDDDSDSEVPIQFRSKRPNPRVQPRIPNNGETPNADSSGDDVPPLNPGGWGYPSSSDDSSSESDSDGNVPHGKPSFNSKAKTATGINYPPRRWRVKSVKGRDIKKLRQFFPGASIETIERTLEATTQYASKGAVEGTTLRQQIQSPNPVLNIPRRNEDVATDTLYSNTPAIDDGSKAAQYFVGITSKYQTAHPVGDSDANFVSALMDEIRRRGAMNTLISDGAKAQLSKRVLAILRTFVIDNWQSEANQQRQNCAERSWKDSKEWTNNLLNISGAPAECWLLALLHVCFLRNHIAYKSLGWRTPIEWLLGHTPDISALLQFRFYQPIYYCTDDAKFPSDSTERIGRFVGISEHVGHGMTFKILTEHGKVISKAVVRSALGPHRNMRIESASEPITDHGSDEEEAGKEVSEFRRHFFDDANSHSKSQKFKEDIEREVLQSARNLEEEQLPTVDIKGLAGRTFISNPDHEGEQHRVKIVQACPTGTTTADGKDAVLKFKCQHGDRLFEEVLSYNKMLEWCDRDTDKDDMHKINAIVGHRRAKLPTTRGDWEVLVEWACGTTTWNCLNLTYSDDPVSVSLHARKNNLLNTPGWKRCKTHVKNMKKFGRMINQARLRNHRRRPVYKYGYQVPRDHEEAVFIDEKNGNTKWQDSEKLELQQLKDYDTFRDLGLGAPTPEGYTKIPCHIIYDCKHDGRHKSRFVAGGHRTGTPIDSVYSGVVSLQGIRLVTFLAELNDLELWNTDIGNAYLESYTTEKVCFTAGPEFGALAGHTMVIVKALYGLKSSGRCWHDRLFDVLQSMGFTPSKAEADIWMRRVGDHYEYVACYVDDLLIASKAPENIIAALERKPHKFALKGTGPVQFHLGCDFFRDETGTLCVGPKKYIERLSLQYQSMFGEKPSTKVTSPLEKNDHPELDTSTLLNEDGITQYQSLIGALQWTISLGRFDVAVAVMTMSGFRVAPRERHLDRLKRIVGYLVKMKNGFIRIRTEMPDFSDLPPKNHDWSHTVYGKVEEATPHDAPTPLGKPVVTTSKVDANLYHDWVTGRAVTGVLHFINKTPFEWFTKKQATVETATYGSEFVAAKKAVEQIMGIRTTLRYLGVPIQGSSRLFGDNGSVVTNASNPHSPLKKRHHALSYHYTREAIASGAVDFQHISGEINASDILSKHWGYSQIWPTLQPILFWTGDTADLLQKNLSPQEADHTQDFKEGSDEFRP